MYYYCIKPYPPYPGFFSFFLFLFSLITGETCWQSKRKARRASLHNITHIIRKWSIDCEWAIDEAGKVLFSTGMDTCGTPIDKPRRRRVINGLFLYFSPLQQCPKGPNWSPIFPPSTGSWSRLWRTVALSCKSPLSTREFGPDFRAACSAERRITLESKMPLLRDLSWIDFWWWLE